MSLSQFWQLVAEAEGQLASLQLVLARLEHDELLAFVHHYDARAAQLVARMREAWSGSEDDAWQISGWGIARGQAWYEAALADPQGLPATCPDLERADLLDEARAAYDDRYGRQPPAEPLPADAPRPAPFVPKAADYPVKVGFFHELAHGDRTGPSLASAVRSDRQRFEAEMLGYLESAKTAKVTLHAVSDLVVPKRGIIGPLHIKTDGVCVWPSDLIHYVRYYHVRLPTWFIDHARARAIDP
jgi:hypothetical protein